MSVLQKRNLVTEIPGPKSRELSRRTGAAVSSGVSIGLPVYVERAEGAIVQDVDGNQLIDMGAGIAVMSVGHSDPRVVSRITEQAGQFTHPCFMVTPYEGYTALCEKLNEHTPGDHDKRSALFNSGSEAIENAVKIARAHTGRSAVIAFDHAYHGRTNLTMALTAKNMPYKQGFGPFASDVYRMSMAYPYRWQGDPETIVEDAFEAFTSAVHAQVGEQNVACVLIEPIQGEGGFIVPPQGWLAKIVDWCHENGIVFIADEVQTGFCRTGDWFACEHEGIVPDLIATAKAVGAGMPISAVTGRAEIMDSVQTGGLGGTFGGNPVSCAAALGAIQVMEEDDLAGRAGHLGDLFHQRLDALAQKYPSIGEVRGRGAMMAMELVKPGTKEPDAALAKALNEYCHSEGVITLTAGTFGNVIRFLPPLVITDALLLEALDVVAQGFAKLG